MTDDELKALVASLAVESKKTDRQLKELGKQIGGLGEKFGSFTEGLVKIIRFLLEWSSKNTRPL
jgi:hypothetical protein